MFIIAAATLLRRSWLAVAALLMFLLGTGVLLLGVLLTTQEVRRSQDQIDYEVRRILGLTLGGVVPDDRRH
jgi:energy-converting hydrogenase Eha subunit C